MPNKPAKAPLPPAVTVNGVVAVAPSTTVKARPTTLLVASADFKIALCAMMGASNAGSPTRPSAKSFST